MGVVSACTPTQSSSEKPQRSESAVVQPEPLYKVYDLPQSTVHTLTIPVDSPYQVTVTLARSLETVENLAKKQGAMAAINGGFFDPNNGKTTSYIIHQGKIIADPKNNERLMKNPDLTRYLDKILNRSEWRRYQCGATVRYSISFHNQPTLTGCQLLDSLGAGPRLLPEMTAQTEGFIDLVNGTMIKDALGLKEPNARTAIGITANGDLIWIMAAQKAHSSRATGLSLLELAEFLKTLGVQEALNLDGGSSSTFYYQGKTYKGKLDREENFLERPVKSVLILQKKL
ncbi:phosphodiester glycosidase family protein [Gloeothece verrucosa]|uniref:Phosphodiester glycosidase domain-containing protein n=1 Tax=Gloeothece verrucosa (strain PCC 7822) TaxID=497965 RepID=E0UG44_GLOV7|nr:phosphodiester glycosidase family protein [Gloeothece verrucosa]ADN15545.1 Protein of unknown function DUF2233, periplasmic [Gloeothece verrucosa PCC 7822]